MVGSIGKQQCILSPRSLFLSLSFGWTQVGRVSRVSVPFDTWTLVVSVNIEFEVPFQLGHRVLRLFSSTLLYDTEVSAESCNFCRFSHLLALPLAL